MSERVRPFSNGTEFMAWTERNCDRCGKGMLYDEDTEAVEFRCPVEEALHGADADDGSLSAEMAARMGYPAKAYTEKGGRRVRYWTWDCPEFSEYPPEETPEYVKMAALGVPPLPGFEVAS